MWTLTEHADSMAKSDLARRLQIRLSELDVALQELERAGKVKLTEIKGKLVVGLLQGRCPTDSAQLSEKITPALPSGQEEAGSKSWWQFWQWGIEMNNYYFITYVTRRLGKQLFDSCVANEHPFDWLRRTQAEHNFQTILAGWQEIYENEYNKHDAQTNLKNVSHFDHRFQQVLVVQ